MSQILLSYSTLNNVQLASHTYVNKLLNIKTPETEYMKKGKEAHKIIQDHVLGINKHPKLSDLTWSFQKAEYHCRRPHDDTYVLHGFADAVDFKSKTLLEIKTTSSTRVWSQADFDRLIQGKYYSYITRMSKILFVTCSFDFDNLKIFYKEFKEKDWQEADEWARKGIEIIRKGSFVGGLNEDGYCTGCSYGRNCYFA